ncbi:MAG: hypothetical protein FWD71_12680 [Oscillospiraceae bacterium]|nr:hypothetical protein [Oscillospiraceae bacterium]
MINTITDCWVSVWARLRQDEVIQIPQEYAVNTDFTAHADISEIKSLFVQINTLYINIYGDIAEQPEKYGMPMHPKDKHRIFSQQWRDSGQAPYRPFILLYNLFICGNMSENNVIRVPAATFKSMNTVRQIHFLFGKLTEYGFVFEGLRNNKFSDGDIMISYPNNAALLSLFKTLAEKARNTDRLDDFLNCHFRLLQDSMNTANYGNGADDVADRVHTEAEKEFVYKMDEALISKGIFRKPYGGFECRGLAYYDTQKAMETKKPYLYRMVSRTPDIEHNIYEGEKLQLMLRVRNVEKCIEYIKTCPDSIQEIFTHDDSGCAHRANCNMGVAYTFNGVSYWKCGCCAPPLRFKPKISDIPHYIKLVELGEKK